MTKQIIKRPAIQGNSNEFMTKEKLRDEFGISLSKQGKLRLPNGHNGQKIPFIKIGRNILYRRKAIVKWLIELELEQKSAKSKGRGRKDSLEKAKNCLKESKDIAK